MRYPSRRRSLAACVNLFAFWLTLTTLSSPALGAPDIQFVEVSGTRGIGSFAAAGGTFGGVAAADYDDDGDVDIFVPNASGISDQLYENDGVGNYTEIAAAAGVDSLDRHRSALFFDYDGDGLLDLAVAGDCYGILPPCTNPTLKLYRQTSPGLFTDVSVAAGLSTNVGGGLGDSVGGMAAGDINGDGYLELFISVWGDASFLFLNNRDGTFSDISDSSGISVGTDVRSFQPVFHDWNNDGLMDIFESIDAAPNRLWINDGDNTFTDISVAAGVDTAFNEMGVAVGDADNDGDLDIFITNIRVGFKHNVLFRNDTTGLNPSFDEIAYFSGVHNAGWGWGTTFFDADGDTWLDLAATNGFGFLPPFSDDPSRFWHNDQNPAMTFTDESASVDFDDTYNGSGLAAFDYDGDGDPDLLQTTLTGSVRLLENQHTGGGSPNNFLTVKPRLTIGGNRRGIGSVVRITIGGNTYMRLIRAGGSMASQEPAAATFGLGAAATVDLVEVTWPDGTTTAQTSVSANQEITITPPIELAVSLPSPLSTSTGPISWTVDYSGADTVTLAPGDVTLVTTGSVTATVGVSGSGTTTRTVTASALSGVGTMRISIAAGTASEIGGGTAPAISSVPPAVIDSDTDGDGVLASQDNCPDVYNPLQEDTDGDGEGDACNDANDMDGDEWSDALDNCPSNANPTQGDWDFDHIGDACDGMVAALSVARLWNEVLLDAIRRDYPAPTVHSRNLFHMSAGMWDAWTAYSEVGRGYFVDKLVHSNDVEASREKAMSYAAYRIVKARFVEPKSSPDSAAYASTSFDALMDYLGYDKGFTASSGGVDPDAELGNHIAYTVLTAGNADGANEVAAYTDPTYAPINVPMLVDLAGVTQARVPGQQPPPLSDPNRWQPLSLEYLILQNGINVGASTQEFLGSHWGNVTPFALSRASANHVYLDPGDPPYLGCFIYPCASDDEFKDKITEVIEFSSWVDPDDNVMIDVSPGAIFNNTLGTNDGTGYSINPSTGQPYAPNVVKRADYGRVLAEFWADGPDSETPPGHWNTLANYVSDHPQTVKRIGGVGPIVNDLEWDVKLYFALNAAVSDAAIAAWDAKRKYDYVRPITQIRYMGGRGQSTDVFDPSFDIDGLPLVPGLIEVVTVASSQPGQRHENVLDDQGQPAIGEIAIRTWPGQPGDPHTQYSGVEWIRAIEWLPYQRETFVTPPFAGYTSGHSTFSRAAAEVLTLFTGDSYFPGGLGTFTAPQGSFLEFENGPTAPITLQWARYYDAADEAGISRLWGGIHVEADDLAGRVMGSQVGIAAYDMAETHFVELTQVPSIDDRGLALLVIAMIFSAIGSIAYSRTTATRMGAQRSGARSSTTASES